MNLSDGGTAVVDSLRTGYRLVLSDAIRILAVGGLMLILLLIFVNSVSRYLFDAPIDGTIDIIRLILMPLVVWFFASALQYNKGRSYGDPWSDEPREEGNITVDFLANRLSDETNELIKLAYLPVVIFVLGGFLRVSWEASMEAWTGQFWTQGTVQLPIWLPRFIITFGVLFLVVELVRQFVYVLVSNGRRALARLGVSAGRS
jgi:TRAP-type C4-dicarboxylate transport system permease small subunit